MAHMRGGDRPFASIHNFLKMLLSPHHNKTPQQDADMPEDIDEPPDHRFLNSGPINMDDDNVVYVKSTAPGIDRQESLLTRALRSSPLSSPTEELPSLHGSMKYRACQYGTASGISTDELTSDGGLTSLSLSNPSPPPPTQFINRSVVPEPQKSPTKEAGESVIEANLGRKRCISFACGRKTEEPVPTSQPAAQTTPKKPEVDQTPTEFVKRKTTLTFVCPARVPETRRERSPIRTPALRSRLRGSPAPVARKPCSDAEATPKISVAPQEKTSPPRGVPTRGLGKFEESEATRFHEFASSEEEDDEWVTQVGEYKEKITLSDCMKKEIAIRKLGEEAEEEALEDEDDDDLDDDDEDDADDDSITSDSSDEDDGNESDNEAGFADSDESDDGSEYGFWAPGSTTAATSPQVLDIPRATLPRRDSTFSFDSANDNQERRWPPALSAKGAARPTKIPKMRPSTPNLPDSTDFVCGTFDEDRPLEAAYKSCVEQRRLSKQIVIPQDIDPSFPTSDPEDEDDEEEVKESFDEAPRGRVGADQAGQISPRMSPKRLVSPPPRQRMVSPPPRRQGRVSPRRLRSPPPPIKLRSPSKTTLVEPPPTGRPEGLNISELVQRPPLTRTKSLPRVPNPFFNRPQHWMDCLCESPEGDTLHARGPIDIVEGLEKKRQKRKEKFWRQHCRKAAREQMERRRIPGKGAERMKDLGLAVAERTRAYGVGDNAQLVLSV